MRFAITSSIWQIIGPFFLLCFFAVAPVLPLTGSLFDLFLVGAGGLFLSAHWGLKGCAYACLLLLFTGIAGHIFWESSHFFRLGLEASLFCSFCIIALVFEQEALAFFSLTSQIESKSSAIQNLEEEAARLRQSLIDAQIESLKKIEELQKSLEELQSDKSSMEILNDVLRKTNAGHFHESEKGEKERLMLKEQLDLSEKTIHDLIKIDVLYKQLKKQFEEKTQVLRETRSILFKTETDVQTLLIEKEEQTHFLWPDPIRAELERADEEMRNLSEENKTLEDLVTHLTENSPHRAPFAMHRTPLPAGHPSIEETLRAVLIPKRKKKVKN